jgi:hypothetical protein
MLSHNVFAKAVWIVVDSLAAAAIRRVTFIIYSPWYAACVIGADIATAAVRLIAAPSACGATLLASMIEREAYEATAAVRGAAAIRPRGSANGAVVRGAVAD